MEEAGVGTEVLANVKRGLTVDRGALVGLPDGGGAAVLIGYADRVHDIGFRARFGGGAGGSGVVALDLYRLTGEVDVHIGGGNEPDLELEEGSGLVRAARRAALTLEGDTVGGGNGIEALFIELRRADGGKIGVNHLVRQDLFPLGNIGTAVLDIEIQLGSCGNLQVDLVDRCEVRQREPSECRRHQNKHGNDAEQEGEFPLHTRLCPFQFIEFLL